MNNVKVRLPVVAVATVALLVGIVAVAQPAGATTQPGTAWGWGANSYGEVGNNTIRNWSHAVAVSNLGGVVSIAAGARHSFAVLADGSVKAWGRNAAGELGTGNTTEAHVPTSVSGLGAGSGVTAVAGGAPQVTATQTSADGHSMALKSNGSVLGWGHGDSGQVGDGVALPIALGVDHNVLSPVAVVGLGASVSNPVVVIAAGGSHSLAAKKDGSVWAWGNNASGQLGDGGVLPGIDKSTPAQVSGLGANAANPVVGLCAGDAFSAALKQDGSVWMWGNNASGELGDNSFNDRSTPAAVSGATGVSEISCGAAFIVALKTDGTVKAWGNNASGQIGNNNAPNDALVPVQVSGLGAGSGVTDIATGHSHVIAHKSGDDLLVWGRNASGQLGDTTTANRNVPTALTLPGVTLIAAGGAHSMAVRTPTLLLSPKKGAAGVTVKATGARFMAGELVTVSFGTNLLSPAATTICTATATSAGSYACSGPIPTTNTGAPGAHTVTATGASSGVSASATFTLTPTVSVSPKSGVAGTPITLTGAHFGAGETVKFFWATKLASPAKVLLCSAVANGAGDASCGGTVPTSNTGPTGSHTITGSGGTTNFAGTTTFTLS